MQQMPDGGVYYINGYWTMVNGQRVSVIGCQAIGLYESEGHCPQRPWWPGTQGIDAKKRDNQKDISN